MLPSLVAAGCEPQMIISRESLNVATEVISQPKGAYINVISQRCSDWSKENSVPGLADAHLQRASPASLTKVLNR